MYVLEMINVQMNNTNFSCSGLEAEKASGKILAILCIQTQYSCSILGNLSWI